MKVCSLEIIHFALQFLPVTDLCGMIFTTHSRGHSWTQLAFCESMYNPYLCIIFEYLGSRWLKIEGFKSAKALLTWCPWKTCDKQIDCHSVEKQIRVRATHCERWRKAAVLSDERRLPELILKQDINGRMETHEALEWRQTYKVKGQPAQVWDTGFIIMFKSEPKSLCCSISMNDTGTQWPRS